MQRIHSAFLKLAFTVGLFVCIGVMVNPATAGIMDFSFAGLVDDNSAGPSFVGQVMNGDGYSATLGSSSDNFMEIQQTPVTGTPLDYFQISIIHFPSAFSNTSYPPSVGMIGAAPFRLVGNGGPITGPLISAPIPPAALLFGAGIVTLIYLGATNWQQTRAKHS